MPILDHIGINVCDYARSGGTDFGKPGIRSDYHDRYYGAFVRGFDGHNLEAVTHEG